VQRYWTVRPISKNDAVTDHAAPVRCTLGGERRPGGSGPQAVVGERRAGGVDLR
jgi:hypothetical protein